MIWKASPPLIETAAAWTSACCLGGAVCFAVARLAPLGAGLVEASVAGALVALVGGVLAGQIDRQRMTRPSFTAVEPLADDPVTEDVLLLEDPLPSIDEDSRVVRLFAAQPAGAEAAPPLAGPGEMVARIENFLGQGRGSADAVRHTDRAAATEDASAALHAALADIRRSLRHG